MKIWFKVLETHWSTCVRTLAVAVWLQPFLLPPDEALSENFLDYKNRGINGSHRGQIVWKIDSGSNFRDCEYRRKPLPLNAAALNPSKRSSCVVMDV